MDEMSKNGSGYVDPTARDAYYNIRKDKTKLVSKLVKTLQNMTHLAGFEIVGRVKLRDVTTGEEYD